ncbi:hypothetical protein C922_05049 [Plasmodium inui San Antonio 1]|uniref:Uncharacterized protein n=1 Tax=Plasmodium inui San Antonio 1 TaxID=1237626 RepID=W6ZZ62_9APIC|nr:hypothetical protein C922_05049 [Plasmodium inui San Antonio 1]EUD64578.1 hypothetical protein C922_05049 [Plasmodium inui San Antonio 1]
MKSVRGSLLYSHKSGEPNVDFLDDIRKSMETKKEDNSEKYIYITSENNMHKRLKQGKRTYTPRGNSGQPTYDYAYDARRDKCSHEDLSRGGVYITTDGFTDQIGRSAQEKLEVEDSSVKTADRMDTQKLFAKDISRNLIDLLSREELMKNEHLMNKMYLTCTKSLYRKMQYLYECGLLGSHRLESKPENDNGVYITEENSLFKRINNLNNDGFTPIEPKSTIVDEYANKLYLTCQNSLFKEIHSDKKSGLQHVKEVLKEKREIQKAEEFAKEKILPKEKKCTLYIYMDDKMKNKDLESKEKDWVLYRHIKDGEIKVELLEDLQTMNEVDMAAVDSVYEETEETLMKNVMEPRKKNTKSDRRQKEEPLIKSVKELPKKMTKRNIRETIKKVAKYGIPGALAVIALPFLVMKYVELARISLIIDTQLAGFSTGLGTAIENVHSVPVSTGNCAVEAIGNIMTIFLGGWGSIMSSVRSSVTCAANVAKEATEVISTAVVDGTAAGTAAGVSHIMIQFVLELSFILAVVMIIEVLFQIFLYLDNRGHLDFIDKYKRRFKCFKVERKYRMRKGIYL